MQEIKLKEFWCETGTDVEELENLIKDLTDATTVETVTVADLNFFGNQLAPNGENVYCEIASVFDNGRVEPHDVLVEGKMKDWNPEIRAEVLANGLLMTQGQGHDEMFLSCFNGVRSDLAFMGISGECTEVEDDTYYLMGMVRQMIERKGKVKLVLRSAEDNPRFKRVITIRSNQYMHIPQKEAYELVRNAFNDGKLESWRVSNQTSEVFYTFKDKGIEKTIGGKLHTVYPYAHFITSDAGESCFAVELGFDVDGRRTYSPNAETARKHKGTWDGKTKGEMAENIANLRDKFTELADKLEELDKIELFYGEPTEVIANLLEDNKKFKKLVKADVRKSIIDEARVLFTKPVHTAAEVMLYLMEVPDRLTNLTPGTIYQIRKAAGEFPYIKIRGFQGLDEKNN